MGVRLSNGISLAVVQVQCLGSVWVWHEMDVNVLCPDAASEPDEQVDLF